MKRSLFIALPVLALVFMASLPAFAWEPPKHDEPIGDHLKGAKPTNAAELIKAIEKGAKDLGTYYYELKFDDQVDYPAGMIRFREEIADFLPDQLYFRSPQKGPEKGMHIYYRDFYAFALEIQCAESSGNDAYYYFIYKPSGVTKAGDKKVIAADVSEMILGNRKTGKICYFVNDLQKVKR